MNNLYSLFYNLMRESDRYINCETTNWELVSTLWSNFEDIDDDVVGALRILYSGIKHDLDN